MSTIAVLKPRKRKLKASTSDAGDEDDTYGSTPVKKSSRKKAVKKIEEEIDYDPTVEGIHSTENRNGNENTGLIVESDDEALLESHRHIWQEPLESYRISLQQKRTKLESDFELEEQAKAHSTALRVNKMATERIKEMKSRQAGESWTGNSSLEPEFENQTLNSNLIEGNDQLNRRKARSEENRLKKLKESERRALLSSADRAAEDVIIQQKLILQREASRMGEHGSVAMDPSSRGARKRKINTVEGENGEINSLNGSYQGDGILDDTEGGKDFSPSGSKKVTKKRIKKNNGGGLESTNGIMDQYGQLLPPSINGDDDDLGADEERFDSIDGSEVDELDSEQVTDTVQPVNAVRTAEQIEELEKKVWTQIAQRDIPKIARIVAQSIATRALFTKRAANVIAREARRGAVRSQGAKAIQTQAKRVMREMLLFTKTNEKKERESRIIAEKAAIEKVKKEEDMREGKRAARKLNFLLTQTELYSHFIGDKVKTNEAEDSADTAGDSTKSQASASFLAAVATRDLPSGSKLEDLDFDADDETNMIQHARRNAQAAMDTAKNAATAFDVAASVGTDQEDLNFQNPSGMDGVQVAQPKLLTCTLKDYQLKGLHWLANLYEQGINGILADEMGLGKTVQSISLMAYLAEVHNIYGPFLVIAPSSTLHNWQQEISRFVPALKCLPYWGNTKDRAVLRKFWNRKSPRYDKDAPFHILVTSYQLVVQDEKYFQGVKWQYMVLDEAQAIKSSTSTRWKTLLNFKCRNRLLLTGTPIQNSMHELWALLHFIMPSLFDSHDEFSEWFSKDIEGNTDKTGAMNAPQLRRLHTILKPFMLRRIKKNVQNELGEKIEIDVYCDLTPRQKVMYRTLRENISITDLVSRSSSLNEDEGSKRLMNLIMQFRKVCNHPELFERADVTAPFAFVSFNQTANLSRDPELLDIPYSTRSNLEYSIPKLIYREKIGIDTLHLNNLFNIWTPDYIQKSLEKDSSSFAFTRLLNLSPSETNQAVRSHEIKRLALSLERFNSNPTDSPFTEAPSHLGIACLIKSPLPKTSTGLIPLNEIRSDYQSTSRLARSDARFYMDKVVAPSIDAVCTDRSFTYDQENQRFDPLFFAAIFGLPCSEQNSQKAVASYEKLFPSLSPLGVLGISDPSNLPFPSMRVPQLKKLILDSGKLAKLDHLLTELKANDHRVLIYFQMTRMIDIMEEFLAFRQHTYLRLDGSSTMTERRDMVTDWQTKPELFIFLLSTRAGGLGINLTAADTVIFYDSDWNPSNDLQAMDRAHRLGQTKQVTVYRLITKDTVDERIVALARNKKLVQDAVVGSSSATPIDPTNAAAKSNEVMSLLLGPDELEEALRMAEMRRRNAQAQSIRSGQLGAATRKSNQETKTAKLIHDREEEERKRKAGGSSWAPEYDDEDAFSFFAETKVTNLDENEDNIDGAEDTPAKSTTAAVPPKRKRRTPEEMRLARENGEPKRVRKKKVE